MDCSFWSKSKTDADSQNNEISKENCIRLLRGFVIMKKQFFIFLLLSSFAFSVSAQKKEARQIDEFGIISCEDFEMRMSILLTELQNSPNSKIYVVYYGGRLRKENVWNVKTGNLDKIKLSYPHRQDGFNRAKSIPHYLTTEETYPAEIRKSLKDKIILIDGGFRQETMMEIWLVPKDAEPPKSNPNINEKDIKFRSKKPVRVPDYTRCGEYA
jgi:hypothetical protein